MAEESKPKRVIRPDDPDLTDLERALGYAYGAVQVHLKAQGQLLEAIGEMPEGPERNAQIKQFKEIFKEKRALPPTVSGKTLGAVLRRLPYWRQLVAEYEARGEWLRPYSLRDTFSVRAHGIVQDDTLIAAAMGHTVEVHHRSYRTSEWRSVRKAFAEAS